MISYDSLLYFPRLNYLRTDKLSRNRIELPIFSLDWSAQEEAIKREFDIWKAKFHPEKDIKLVSSLPEDYDKRLKSLEFAINDTYYQEIQYMSRRALEEWNRPRNNLDTVVRDSCLAPAAEFVWCAFYLLADCIYDNTTNWMSHDPWRGIAANVMAAKFWHRQTGGALVLRKAKIDELEKWCSRLERNLQKEDDGFRKDQIAVVRDWIDAIKRHRSEELKATDEARIWNFDKINKSIERSLRGHSVVSRDERKESFKLVKGEMDDTDSSSDT